MLGSYNLWSLSGEDWRKATGAEGKLTKHGNSEPHLAAEKSYKARTTEVQSSASVGVLLSQAYADKLKSEAEEKARNRSILCSIVDIVRFLAKQNISFRGDDESATSANRGNFLELVQFTAKYNTDLRNWLENHPRNVSWLSPQIQNEILHTLAQEVVSVTVGVCQGRIFSILCDEVSDRSNRELLSLVIRFVTDEGDIRESLVSLIEVDNTSACYLHDVIVDKLKSLCLSIDNLVGQCFDGASNMSGIHTGLQARMKDTCSRKPVFVHCWAHVLNLVVHDVIKVVPACSKVFDILQQLYVFIEGSPKRHSEYLGCLSDVNLEAGPTVMQTLSATRWYARCINLRIAHRCLPVIKRFLEGNTSSDASGLLTALKDVQFQFGLEFLRELFISINATSEALQSSDIDLAAAATAITSLKAQVASMRNDCGEFDRIVAASGIESQLTEKHASKRMRTVPSKLQNCVMDRFLSTSADAVTTTSAAEKTKLQLRLDFFIPVLDAVLVALDSRFNTECITVIECISSVVKFDQNCEPAIRKLCSIAKIDADLCSADAKHLLRSESFDSVYQKVTSLHELLSKMIELKHSVVFKHFFELIVYLCTLPVTSAACERAHSKVALIKSAVRASMGSERLEDLVIISSEKCIVDNLDLASVVSRFSVVNRGLPL